MNVWTIAMLSAAVPAGRWVGFSVSSYTGLRSTVSYCTWTGLTEEGTSRYSVSGAWLTNVPMRVVVSSPTGDKSESGCAAPRMRRVPSFCLTLLHGRQYVSR